MDSCLGKKNSYKGSYVGTYFYVNFFFKLHLTPAIPIILCTYHHIIYIFILYL